MPVDVQALGCDFFVCSGHKMYGPMGTGLLYGREELLDRMPPYQGGGDMIDIVGIERSTFAPLPAKFEAGTPNVAGVVGLGAALGWIESVGRAPIGAHEDSLVAYAIDQLGAVAGLSVRRPWKLGCRKMPSCVHSANRISATSLGITQWAPFASYPVGGFTNGGVGRSRSSSLR